MECPACLRVVPIPAPLTFPHEKVAGIPVLPRDVLALEMKILCPSCDNKLRLDARLEGQSVTCPVCSAKIAVPLWSRPATASASPQIAALSAAEIEFLSGMTEPVLGKGTAA